jgi:thiol-disulfide isomerase/thioredoxin
LENILDESNYKKIKLKRNLIITGLLLFTLTSIAQDAKEILQKSYAKCQSVQNGYYEMTKYMKYLNKKDTIETSFDCYFKKLKDDSLFSSAFHFKEFYKNEWVSEVLYTGEDLVNISLKDSSGFIMSKSKWAKEIKSYSQNYTFFQPLTDKKCYPFISDSGVFDKKYAFNFIGEEVINNASYYHIQITMLPEYLNKLEGFKFLRVELNYWIGKENMIPNQFSSNYLVMEKDTMEQYEKYVLKKVEINNLKDDSILTLQSLPLFYKLKTYEPHTNPELLPNDTIAPDWNLLSLKDERIGLKDLTGKLVLIDFFYMSCYPCMQALPKVEALYEKYKEKGLVIIGIDPYDKKEDGIEKFLSKRGVNYTVLLKGKDVAKDYHVSGYPTVYLIDKNGKILFSMAGYSSGEDMLDGIIKRNL